MLSSYARPPTDLIKNQKLHATHTFSWTAKRLLELNIKTIALSEQSHNIYESCRFDGHTGNETPGK